MQHAPMPETALRLFIGLRPEGEARTSLQAHQRLWRWPAGVRLLEAEHLHLTLHFLGLVHSARVDALQHALAEIPMTPIPLLFRTPAAWSVAVLLAEENAALRDLRQRLMVPLLRLGLPVDGHWTPHVTLARHAKGAVPPSCPPLVHWTAGHFSLVLSTLSPRPPYVRHEVLRRYPTQA